MFFFAVDKTWVNVNAQGLFEEATGCPVVVLNDADAAGLAEMNFGEGRGHEDEVVLVTTFGTGIGTALYVEGKLVRWFVMTNERNVCWYGDRISGQPDNARENKRQQDSQDLYRGHVTTLSGVDRSATRTGASKQGHNHISGKDAGLVFRFQRVEDFSIS